MSEARVFCILQPFFYGRQLQKTFSTPLNSFFEVIFSWDNSVYWMKSFKVTKWRTLFFVDQSILQMLSKCVKLQKLAFEQVER